MNKSQKSTFSRYLVPRDFYLFFIYIFFCLLGFLGDVCASQHHNRSHDVLLDGTLHQVSKSESNPLPRSFLSCYFFFLHGIGTSTLNE